MNERMKQLMLECYNPYGNFDHKKFSELMIKECQQTLINNGYDDAAQCLQDVHFGMTNHV